MTDIITERYELAIGRILEMKGEVLRDENLSAYFHSMAEFALMIDELREELKNGSYQDSSLERLKAWNRRLYKDILPKQYEESYANPAYSAKIFGEKLGNVLCVLYAELRAAIPYVFEDKQEYLAILLELLLEAYNLVETKLQEESFQENCQEENQEQGEKSKFQDSLAASLREIIYWYASDYCDVILADRIKEQILPEMSFATSIIENSNLEDLRYLYMYGEYVSENEIQTAKHLNELPEEVIRKMAFVYTDGYARGFVNTGKDLSIKSSVNIRYVLGFERVIRQAISNFRALGLEPVIYRAAASVITKRQHIKIGFYGAIANKQYEYDHRNDQMLFLDKKYIERKLEVMKTTYEEYKEDARSLGGPACMEVFGEKPFSPISKEEIIRPSKTQEEMLVSFNQKQSQLTNRYIPGDERSFTIIAFPVPEIGEKYKEIFDEIIKINTLDADLYQKVQQTLIDALDQGDYVHILGSGKNHTNLKVKLYELKDPEKETIFENCVADVNIPVGEVFTSPVLEGTNGILHVTRVYLEELEYRDLEIEFSNGMIADYHCKNFERELENREYIFENILFRHPTLPMGEFAIGTNTTAYVAARKYGIEETMPILIAEKMGPHFAVGDTCYSWEEDTQTFNPDGKSIVARENSVSALRKEDPSKAYFQCHTDITIPYDELGSITVVTKSGEKILLIKDGKFVLPGTEVLNEPLEKMD